jgi:AcrR family transcriptional regulator
MIDAAAEDGYAAATVARVIKRAGVSRTTFYEHFRGRHACFLAALEHIHQRLTTRIGTQIEHEPPERALHAALTAMLGFFAAEPAMARVLTLAVPAAGLPALDAREHAIADVAQLIEGAYASLAPELPVPEIAPAIALGAVQRLLAMHLRRDEQAPDALLTELTLWLESYNLELAHHRWRTLTPHPPPPASDSAAPLHIPPARARGAIERSELLENHRQRILYAAAHSVAQKGYRDTTISDITSLAALDTRAFYRLFNGKEAVFLAVLELYFQHVMSVAAGAFFGAGDWPQRIWAGAGAFAHCMDQHRALAHVVFIDSYTAARPTAQRVDEFVSAFTIFLQEGYGYAPGATPPSALVLQAIATSNFELVYRQLRRGQPSASLLRHVTHLTLTPFTGAAAATSLISELAPGPGVTPRR